MIRSNVAYAAAVMAAALLLAAPIPAARAQHLPYSRMHRDLTPALQKALNDKVSDQAGPYLDKEDEKKQQGKTYTDLQQKFEYLPNYGPRGQLVVSVKLGGAEYNPAKSGSSKGAATGTLRYLVFTYALDKGKWVEVAKPKWESQKLGEQAAAAPATATASATRIVLFLLAASLMTSPFTGRGAVAVPARRR